MTSKGKRDLAGDLARTIRARMAYQPRKRVARRDAAPATEAAEAAEAAAAGWEPLRAAALACRKCALCETRTTVVFGEGAPDAPLMFVGEAPGRDEDRSGRPFVGRAGQLLTDMIAAMGFRREEVYIANVLKCRPPENRDPLPDEIAACSTYLLRQVDLVDPKVICTLGRFSMRLLIGEEVGGITRVRGRVFRGYGGRTVVPTYHPAYLLRNPPAKREAWEDLKTILGILGRPVPPSSKSRDR